MTATLNAQETEPASQLDQDNADAIQSIQAYWQYRGDYPENSLITIPEGDWIPDANDPDFAELDFMDYFAWLEANDPDNAEWLTEYITFWLDDGMDGDNAGDFGITVAKLKGNYQGILGLHRLCAP